MNLHPSFVRFRDHCIGNFRIHTGWCWFHGRLIWAILIEFEVRFIGLKALEVNFSLPPNRSSNQSLVPIYM
jgi:hypothetical protein